MSDAAADTDGNKLAPEGLPPPAHVVGGVRHPAPTRAPHVDPAKHGSAAAAGALPATEKTETAVDAAAAGDQQQMQAVAAELPAMSVKDAAEHPKAVPSTYFPPDRVHTQQHDHNTKGHINTRGQQKHIQQPGGSHNR